MLDLLWFVLMVGAILVAGLLIGLVVVWAIGWLTRRGGGDEEAGLTPVGPVGPGATPDAVRDHASGAEEADEER